MSKETLRKFVDRLTDNSDPLSNVVTVHLFCENAINKLINEKAVKVKNYRKKIKDKSFIPILESNYANKLYFVYSLGLIEELLYENLRLLNFWRNKAAHNVDVNLKELPMDFYVFDKRNPEITTELTEQQIVIGIAFATYVELHTFIEEKYEFKL